jgi:nicotinamide phosphoribosyltransferase
MITNPLTQVDAYKLSHHGFMDPLTEYIYANQTPRGSRYLPVLKEFYDDKSVIFGLQHFIIDFLINDYNNGFFNLPKETVIKKFKRRCDAYLGKDNVDMTRFEELHDLGYLPIRIKALPEGSRVNVKVPYFTITNTHPKFAWLTNYLETIISCETWKPITNATIAFEFRKMFNKFAMETVGNTDGVCFQGHGFEFRGMSGRHDSAINGAAFLLSFMGTDTMPAIDLLEDYYNADADKELIAASVPASEHSISSLGTALTGELEFFRDAITKHYPTGIVSLVSDTYDYFKVITEYATILKDDILNRQPNELGLAKVVFRPDSGNPVDIICGINIIDLSDKPDLEYAKSYMEDAIVDQERAETPHGEMGNYEVSKYFKFKDQAYSIKIGIDWNRYDKQYYYIDGHRIISCDEVELTPQQKGSVECLWEIFGGTVSTLGYKTLNQRVSLIYGDSITQQRAFDILTRLKEKGFASNNIVFGVGSYTLNLLTRDCLGMAIKATWAQVDGVGYDIYKDPITDNGLKRSAKGRLRVDLIDGEYVLKDQCTEEEESGGELKTVFLNGILTHDQTLSEIRERVAKNF